MSRVFIFKTEAVNTYLEALTEGGLLTVVFSVEPLEGMLAFSLCNFIMKP